MIRERWEELLASVERSCARAGRSPDSVRIVAVSKNHPPDAVIEAYQAGVRIFGENYVQEALPKIEATRGMTPEASWHFIGALQSNKAKQVVGRFSLLHSLDRWSLAAALEKEKRKTGLVTPGLLEVNLAGEESKSGVAVQQVRPLLERISGETSIEVRGLMTFPPLSDDPEEARRYFASARELGNEIASWKLPRIEMNEFSMGVTSDFEVAIEEGATLIRIGTAIFGTRS
ncbi:MAG: YggS family pyridoxal phosphate-dependent enzyme [Pseudomonadota bacterium]